MLSQHEKEFDSSEHNALGAVNLSGLPAGFTQFTLTNGARLTFGDIIALAGDYYGVPEKPICQGSTEQERIKRFLAAYNTLAKGNVSEITNLLNLIKNERHAVDTALENGTSVSAAINAHNSEEYLHAVEYTKGRFVELAERNLDHFNEQAIIAYQTGHQLAMLAAIDARKISDSEEQQKQLEYAYTLEAYACHFLTDHFATGHIRTPRAQLEKQFDAVIGSLLSLFQHNEDGDSGLEVANKRGDVWKAYGDGHLFEEVCADTKTKAKEAVQTAVDEIYQAFKTGKTIQPEKSAVYQLIPDATSNNYSAMFLYDATTEKISYRSDLNDKYCKKYDALTNEGVLRILDHFAEQYVDDDIVQGKIASVRKSISTDAHRLENCAKYLYNWSLFKCFARDNSSVIKNTAAATKKI